MLDNKVDTTNRCEALKEVMSLNFELRNISIFKIQNISDIFNSFTYNIPVSNILHITDVIELQKY